MIVFKRFGIDAESAGHLEKQVDQLLSMNINQVQRFVNWKPNRERAFPGMSHGCVPRSFALIRIGMVAEKL